MKMKICVWGDSIVWGSGDHEKGGWVERLKLHYMEKTSEEVKVYNLGISGGNTDDLLRRFETEAKERKPRIIMFAIGTNDSSYFKENTLNRVSVEKFENNLAELANIAQTITNRIIFVGLTLVNESKTMPIPWNVEIYYDNKNIIKYDKIIETFCEKNKIQYISMYKVLTKEDLKDGLHPNPVGHEKIFRIVLQELEK